MSRRVDTTLVTFGRSGLACREGDLEIRQLRAIGHILGHPARPIAPSLPQVLHGADVVHAHQLRSTSSILAGFVARARGLSTAATDHGLQGPEPRRLIAPLFDRFLMVSRYSARELRTPPHRTSLVYGGADPQRYWPDEAISRRGVLFVGRVTPHKGIDGLIQALPAGAALAIVGSSGHDPRPPERDYPQLLRRLAAGRDVQFVETLADADLPRIYRCAEVLALPSVSTTCYGRRVRVSELLGLAILEAMASGTPVVASRLGGVPEIVEHGVTGYLVEPGNQAALHDALAELLANRALARRMGRAARERVVAELTWDRCAERCLEAYGGLAADP